MYAKFSTVTGGDRRFSIVHSEGDITDSRVPHLVLKTDGAGGLASVDFSAALTPRSNEVVDTSKFGSYTGRVLDGELTVEIVTNMGGKLRSKTDASKSRQPSALPAVVASANQSGATSANTSRAATTSTAEAAAEDAGVDPNTPLLGKPRGKSDSNRCPCAMM